MAKNLDAKQLSEFKVKLRTAIETADKAIYATKSELPGLLSNIGGLVENVLTFGSLAETKKRINNAYDDSVKNWELQKKVYWGIVGTGRIGDGPVTTDNAEKVFKLIGNNIKRTQEALNLVKEYTGGKILSGAVGKTFGRMAEVLGTAFDAVMALGKGVATTVKTIGYLFPVIIGVVVLGPFLLRTFSAYRKGGASAAADAAASSIESGRDAAGRAIATGTKKILTRGMAGYSAPKRRNVRRKS